MKANEFFKGCSNLKLSHWLGILGGTMMAVSLIIWAFRINWLLGLAETGGVILITAIATSEN